SVVRRVLVLLMISNGSPLLWAGEATPSPKKQTSATVEKKEKNPFSLWDGRLVFDIEERVRLEWRDNNRDFNSAISDDNDDVWILNRFRLGLTVKPVSWLKIYGQTQDSREAFSERANIPGVR